MRYIFLSFMSLVTLLLGMMISQYTSFIKFPEFSDSLRPFKARTLHQEHRFFSLPLNNPPYVVGAQPFMRGDDVVLGVRYKGVVRAYPLWVLSKYHVVNDTFNYQDPLFIAFCEMCSSTAAFIPLVTRFSKDSSPDEGHLGVSSGVNPMPLSFRMSGLGFGTFQICDTQTLSLWHPFSGESLTGPLLGAKMERVPVYIDTWKNWLNQFPNTQVILASSEQRLIPHGRQVALGLSGIDPIFSASSNTKDLRLPLNEMVLGLTVDSGHSTAIPLTYLDKTTYFQGRLDNSPYVVFFQKLYMVAVYSPIVEGKVLVFSLTTTGGLRDQQTGSLWTFFGECIEGAYKGMQLTVLNGRITEWVEWVSYYPKTQLVTL